MYPIQSMTWQSTVLWLLWGTTRQGLVQILPQSAAGFLFGKNVAAKRLSDFYLAANLNFSTPSADAPCTSGRMRKQTMAIWVAWLSVPHWIHCIVVNALCKSWGLIAFTSAPSCVTQRRCTLQFAIALLWLLQSHKWQKSSSLCFLSCQPCKSIAQPNS